MEIQTIHRLSDASLSACAHWMCVVDRWDDDRPGGGSAAGATGSNLGMSRRGSGTGSTGWHCRGRGMVGCDGGVVLLAATWDKVSMGAAEPA